MHALLFLTSFSLFFFQYISIHTSALVMGSAYNYSVIGLAILGLTASASLVSLFEYTEWKPWRLVRYHRRFDAVVTFGIALSVIFFFMMATRMNEQLNLSANPFMIPKKVQLTILLVTAFPYFLFGILISRIFLFVPKERYYTLYFADLAGGALGLAFSYWAMKRFDFPVLVSIPVAVCLVAVIPAGPRARRLLRFIAALACLGLLALAMKFAPGVFEPRLTHRLVFNDKVYRMTENARWWTNSGHLSRVQVEDEDGGANDCLVLGKFEGIASLVPYSPDYKLPEDNLAAAFCMSLGPPKDALVLLAGAGADMVSLNAYTKGRSNISGVEINSKIRDAALGLPQLNLKKFFQQKNIQLYIREARLFLERDKNKYDVILISWSGATYAYYSGAITHSTRYIYTQEALDAMMKRLKPGGFIVYLNTNKLRIVEGVKRAVAGTGVPAHRAAIVLDPKNSAADWFDPWDNDVVLIKPDGFTDEQVAQVRQNVDKLGYQLAYAPGQSLRGSEEPYGQMLRTPRTERFLEHLRKKYLADFRMAKDDNPFVFQLYPPENYFSKEFFKHVFFPPPQGRSYQERYMFYVFLVAIFGGVSILGPMALFSNKKVLGRLDYIGYFSASGAGFMLIEVALIQTMSLFLGKSGYATALVLGLLIFFAGLGSAASHWFFSRKGFFTLALASLCVYLTFLTVNLDNWSKIILPTPSGVRGMFAVLLIAPVGFMLGKVFPLGLAWARSENRALVPWGWAVNGAMGCVAASLSPILASVFGCRMLLLMGTACYCLVLMLYISLPSIRQKG